MPIKDRYGNNLRVGNEVSDLRPGAAQKGVVRGSDHDKSVIIEWDSGDEEKVLGEDLVCNDRRFGGLGRRR